MCSETIQPKRGLFSPRGIHPQRFLRGLGLCLLGCALPHLAGCRRPDAAAAKADPPALRPNIVFILVDTLRADRLGAYGDKRGLTPMMDDLARQGLTVEMAISACPWTLPSVASFFTGFFPTAHRAITTDTHIAKMNVGQEPQVQMLADRFISLAETLQAGGYETAAFVANPFIRREYGFAQGFDHFDSTFANNLTPGSVVNAAALKWIAARDKSRPLFLYLHYMDPHGPYRSDIEYIEPLLKAVEAQPQHRELTRGERQRYRNFFDLRRMPAEYTDVERHQRLAHFQEYWAARYDAGVRQSDHFLGELNAALSAQGVWEDALVILAADHGEALGTHEVWGHGFSTHHDQLHVPLILRWPKQIPANTRMKEMVRTVDLLPTLLEKLGLPPLRGIQGESFASLLPGAAPQEKSPPAGRVAFGEGVKQGAEQKALYADGWMLHLFTESARLELYDISRDPEQRDDLASRETARLAAMKQQLDRVAQLNEELARAVETTPVTIDEQQVQRLKALGYLGGDESDESASRPAPSP